MHLKKLLTLQKRLVLTAGSFLICFIRSCLFGVSSTIFIQKCSLKKYLSLYAFPLMTQTRACGCGQVDPQRGPPADEVTFLPSLSFYQVPVDAE